jgi:hypothetical protein
VPTKTKVRKLVPSRKPTAFDPATLPSRNSRRGSSGASTLVSMTKNTVSSATPAASMTTVRGEAQPACGACEIAYTKTSRAAVIETAPNGSYRRLAVPARLSGISRGISISATTPIGTLNRKMYGQPT